MTINSYKINFKNKTQVYYPKNAYLTGICMDNILFNQLNVDEKICNYKPDDFIFVPWDSEPILTSTKYTEKYFEILGFLFLRSKLKENYLSVRFNPKHYFFQNILKSYLNENGIKFSVTIFDDFIYYSIYDVELFKIIETLYSGKDLTELFETRFKYKNSFSFLNIILVMTSNRVSLQSVALLEFFKKLCYINKKVIYLNNSSKLNISFYEEGLALDFAEILDIGYLVKIDSIELSDSLPISTDKNFYQGVII